MGEIQVALRPGSSNEHGFEKVVQVDGLSVLVLILGEPHIWEIPFGKPHDDDVLPLQPLGGVDGGEREVLVDYGNLALHVVLLDEPGEGVPVDSEG